MPLPRETSRSLGVLAAVVVLVAAAVVVIQLEVTPLVQGRRVVDLALTAASSESLRLRSREGSAPPQLVLRLEGSGEHGGNTELIDIWTDLHRAGAELVLNGHDHNYERFAPQDPAGQPDAQRGIRQFVVGTGGKAGRGFGLPVGNSETRNSGLRGVLRLELRPEGDDWRFAPWPGWTSPMRGRTNATEPVPVRPDRRPDRRRRTSASLSTAPADGSPRG